MIHPNGASVMSFRMTDIFGQVIEEKDFDTRMTETQLNNVDRRGTVQFPR